MSYVTQWFPPETTKTPLWIARALRRRGLAVEIVTGIPNYPTGKVHTGYRAWQRSREEVDGFRVVRNPLFPSHGHSAVGRMTNLASYALSSTVFGQGSIRQSDVALVYSSPATAASAAMYARRRSGVPYVLLILDLWPDSVFASGFLHEGVARRVAESSLSRFTQAAYRGAEHVAVTTPGMKEKLVARGVSAEKISLVYNWVDEEIMKPCPADSGLRPQLGIADDDFVLMYAGNHGVAQALETLIDAMDRVRDLPDVHLVMLGSGVQKQRLIGLAKERGLFNIHFLGEVDPRRIPPLLAAADVQIVSLARRELFELTIPSKVQSIMACARPMIICGAGDAARAVTDAAAGFVCPPEDATQLGSVIRQARDVPREDLVSMGLSGRNYYQKFMGEDVGAESLTEILRNAARARSEVKA
ncbi:glycosyltransferase family 4 protein [Mangrovihabitans endophyticus]|uniref:Glycosyltransferase WbuB n=1 Tax=Mangrovihabitans endophyticus TaxID=1751298 RepID=A0A8J3C275_9ACTN|nr:glycosyltransferase family 4 protein [Mangrovihabitans endophyticus]GGL04426.1 glycosyltransferase WbuB [Mangrovihabitans endophyticus]